MEAELEGQCAQVCRAHPECMAICVAGALSAHLEACDGPLVAKCAFSEITLQHMGGHDVDSLQVPAGLLALVRSLFILKLELTSAQQLIAYVIMEAMLQQLLGRPSMPMLQPMLIAAAWLAIKLGDEVGDGNTSSLEVLGERLEVLEALEGKCLCLLEWRIPIDREVYEEAAARLLQRLDFYARQLVQPGTTKKSVSRIRSQRRPSRCFSPTSVLSSISEH